MQQQQKKKTRMVIIYLQNSNNNKNPTIFASKSPIKSFLSTNTQPDKVTFFQRGRHRFQNGNNKKIPSSIIPYM